MRWDKKVRIDVEKTHIINVLRNQALRTPLCGTVTDDQFKIYKAICKWNWRLYHFFSIQGKIVADGQVSVISYTMKPAISSRIAAIVLVIVSLCGLWISVRNEKGVYFIITIVLSNFLFYVDLIWQAHKCQELFQKEISIT